MYTRGKLTAAAALALVLLAACGPATPAAAPTAPAATAAPPTSEPAATATARVPTVVPPTEVGAAALGETLVPGEALAPGEAVIWYLGHCGYAVRTQNHFLVFDYQQRYDGPEAKPRPAQPSLEKGFVVPQQLADLRVRVFVSHQHTDHYDPSILTWQQTVSDIAYFLGWQARETDDPAFHFLVGPRAAWQSDDMEVYTINSHHSDVPEVAYLVKVDGLVIYHNGDYQGDFRQDYPFLREISAQIDLAFVPNDYDEQSPYYFPQNVDLFQQFAHRAIFPMHDSAERGHYADFAQVYQARLPGLPIHRPQRIGERFLFQDGRIVGGGPAAPASTEEISFHSGPFQVVGDLKLPAGQGPHPVVIFVHGDGPNDRTAGGTYGPIMERMQRAGYATFAWDKPGTGESTGQIDRSRLVEQRAQIVLDAIEVLKGDPDIDPQQIGLWGISQAGYVMPRVLSQSEDIAFMIAVSCPGEAGVEQGAYLVTAQALCAGLPEEDADQVEYLLSAVNRAQTYEEYVRYKEQLAAYPALAAITELGLNMEVRPEEQWHADDLTGVYYAFDPIEIIERTTIPVLAFFGDRDTQVDPIQGAQAYRAALDRAGNPNSHVELIPGVDHNLVLCETGCLQERNRRPRRGWINYPPLYLDLLEEWLWKLYQ